MKIFRFLPQSRTELLEEIGYYGSLQKGLGIRFEKAFVKAVRRAVANPEYGSSRTKNTRRLIVKGFPFSVIYRVSDLEVLIVAIADSRRKPEYWAARIK